MDYSKLNLKKLCIFDLTNDVFFIKENFGIDLSDANPFAPIETKEDYNRSLSNHDRITDFIHYARVRKDKALLDAVNTQFGMDLTLSFLEENPLISFENI